MIAGDIVFGWEKQPNQSEFSAEFVRYTFEKAGITGINSVYDADNLKSYLESVYTSDLVGDFDSTRSAIDHARRMIINPEPLHRIFLKVLYDRSPEVIQASEIRKIIKNQGYSSACMIAVGTGAALVSNLGIGGIYERFLVTKRYVAYRGDSEKMEFLWEDFLADPDFELPRCTKRVVKKQKEYGYGEATTIAMELLGGDLSVATEDDIRDLGRVDFIPYGGIKTGSLQALKRKLVKKREAFLAAEV